MNNKYVIGLDFGTLSGRAILVRCCDGSIAASSVKPYDHGVMDKSLPGSTVKLPPDFALEHPQDYLNVLEHTIPALLKDSGICKENIIGLAIDFTACTMLPIDENAVPLCLKPEWEDHPHAYVKLWKHHGAQKQADQINQLLHQSGKASEPRFGGKVSPELMLPKIMETFEHDRELYENTAEFIEAGDWLTRILTGSRQRSGSMAGYKAWWTPDVTIQPSGLHSNKSMHTNCKNAVWRLTVSGLACICKPTPRGTVQAELLPPDEPYTDNHYTNSSNKNDVIANDGNLNNGYPGESFYAEINPDLKHVIRCKMPGKICNVGKRIGELNMTWARKLGLMPQTAVAATVIDSHAGVPGSGICNKNQMMLVVGTSSVMIALSEKPYAGQGICGSFKGGIVPGYYALESGLAAVGDLLAWFTDNCVPVSYVNEARRKGISIHEYLTQKASAYAAGESGLLALDWWNGNKTPYVDGELRGTIIGFNLRTKPEELYRTLIESTAFGTRIIMEEFEKAGVEIEEIVASGGIASKNALFMQIYADVLGKPIKLADSDQTAALGSAIYAALAAGKSMGGHDSYEEAVKTMSRQKAFCFQPCRENSRIYDRLYAEYCRLGKKMNDPTDRVLHNLRDISQESLNRKAAITPEPM